MATQKQWERTEESASAGFPYSSCLLELRAKVEALEAAQKPRVSTAEEVASIVAGRLATDEELLEIWDSPGLSSIDSFREIYKLGLKHGALQATCPHIRSSDEGTSYCALAEQAANCKSTANDCQTSSWLPTGLVERVEKRIKKEKWMNYRIDEDECARAAIREVAAAARLKWEEEAETTWKQVAQWLEQEAGQ